MRVLATILDLQNGGAQMVDLGLLELGQPEGGLAAVAMASAPQ